MKKINRKSPAFLYFHPWEGHENTPRVKLSPLDSFVTYHGIGSALGKLDILLRRFSFGTVDRVLGLG
jgi:hypothetical protein